MQSGMQWMCIPSGWDEGLLSMYGIPTEPMIYKEEKVLIGGGGGGAEADERLLCMYGIPTQPMVYKEKKRLIGGGGGGVEVDDGMHYDSDLCHLWNLASCTRRSTRTSCTLKCGRKLLHQCDFVVQGEACRGNHQRVAFHY